MLRHNKYLAPKYYYDLATAHLQYAYRQLFSFKILLFALALVSATTGYARPMNFVQSAARVFIREASTASFTAAQSRTAAFEGGFQMDRSDNGNWTGGRRGKGRLVGTNFGISAPMLAAFLGRTPSVSDMKGLTQEQANEIYRRIFWSEIKGDEIKDPETANQIYDSAVNMGIGTAIKLTQRSLGLPETGVMDDATLDALNAAV